MKTSVKVKPWTKDESEFLEAEIKSNKYKSREEAFRALVPIMGRSHQSLSYQYYSVINVGKVKSKPAKETKLVKLQPKPKVVTTASALNAGQKIMQTVLGCDITASSITITPTEMVIKF